MTDRGELTLLLGVSNLFYENIMTRGHVTKQRHNKIINYKPGIDLDLRMMIGT